MNESVPHYFLYGQTDASAELDFLHIETMAEAGSAYQWEIAPHRHDHLLQLLWVDRGQINASLDGDRHSVYGPGFIVVPPSVVHGFQLETGTIGLVLTIADSFLRNILCNHERSELSPLLRTPWLLQADKQARNCKQAVDTFRVITDEYRRQGPARTTYLSALCKTLLVQLLRLIPDEQTNSVATPASRQHFERFQHLLEHHYRNSWNVSRYATELGLSEKRLNRICRDVTDLTPKQLIHNRLIAEAKRCLVYTGLSINEIAYELGYKDPAYFSRFFHRMEGQQASAFRRSVRRL
ncbi:MAG: AraC family transcriptional regulator [Cycloclasticus sp.]|nr:AraC family transcriptional regulator [Cycloclasticus sp.]|tara:strand:- start:14891 stop:15775 length:885 start_codon:yes stop_codon:yes gene_type:complete